MLLPALDAVAARCEHTERPHYEVRAGFGYLILFARHVLWCGTMGLMPTPPALPLPTDRLPFLRRRSGRFPIGGALAAPPAGPLRVGVVLHAEKRRTDAARQHLQRAIAAAGWPPPRIYPTTASAFGAEQSRAALDAGCELIVACGGDGTIRTVAEQLRHTGVPLGILPIGTGNIFARNLLLPQRDLARAARIALHGALAAVDLGIATTTVGERRAEHLFLVLAGIGNDAETVLATRPDLKAHMGWLAYLESAARHALRAPVAMTLHYPANPPRKVRAWSVIAGNCGKVPGGIAVFPGAVIDDGVLDVLEVTVRHPLQWLPIGVKGLLHLRAEPPGLRHAISPAVTIEPDEPSPVQVDGDVITGVSRLRVTLDHRALAVRVPSRLG